jgi:hypothetical protein
MTTGDLVESFINEAVWALKKNHRGQLEGRMLDRHEPVEIDGYTYTTWREFATHGTAEHIRHVLPDADIQVVLDGNNSCIELALTDEEQRKLNSSLFVFLKKYNCV